MVGRGQEGGSARQEEWLVIGGMPVKEDRAPSRLEDMADTGGRCGEAGMMTNDAEELSQATPIYN